MKKYVIIDRIRNGDQFEDLFDRRKDALAAAERDWNHLGKHDQDRREEYFVMVGEVDEDGDIGDEFWNTGKVIKTYKGKKETEIKTMKNEIYYMADSEHIDQIYGDLDPVCVTLTEIEHLAREWDMTTDELLEQFHEATDEEIDEFGIEEE